MRYSAIFILVLLTIPSSKADTLSQDNLSAWADLSSWTNILSLDDLSSWNDIFSWDELYGWLHGTPPIRSSPSVLYVWSGQDASVNNAADFVAVIDFDERSATYGQIVKTIPLVSDAKNGIGQIGNEPHHSGVSSDGRYFITGGLLSFLSGNKEVFVWRIPKNPKDGPQFLCALDVPGACVDEFLPIGGPNFIVSMMCNTQATSPGDMVLIDAETCISKSIIKNASSIKDFNPHGFGRLKNGSLFVSDFIDPISLVGNDSSQIVFRNTVRHFLPDGTLERTYYFDFPNRSDASAGVGKGIGFMELKTIPGDPLGRSVTSGSTVNNMYLIGPGMSNSLLNIDLSQVNGYQQRISAGITTIFANGKRLLMTFQMRYILLLNIANPERPKILRAFDFCSDDALKNVNIGVPGSSNAITFSDYCAKNNNITGAHVVLYQNGENRFIVVNYFLKFGLAQFAGTRTVHAFKFNNRLTDFKYDHRFNPNYNDQNSPKTHYPTFHSLQGYPHHVQYLKLHK